MREERKHYNEYIESRIRGVKGYDLKKHEDSPRAVYDRE